MDGKLVRRALFLVFFLSLFLLVARLFYPFLTILLWSGLIYAIFAPLHNRLALNKEGKERGDAIRSLIAGLFAVGGILVIVTPVVFLAISMMRQVGDLTGAAIHAIESKPEWFDLSPSGPIGKWIFDATQNAIDLSSIDLRGEMKKFLMGSTKNIIGFSGAIIKNAASLVLTIAFMIFTLFFFFMDGRHLIKILVGAVPIERDLTRLFLRKLRDTSRQLVQGYLLVALYQSTVAFILFSLFKVKGPLVLAALTAVASFIPMVGTGLIWIPISATRIASGDITGGVILLILCAVLISTMDNFIRPILLRDRLKIHPLLIFFAILGGLSLFGFNGLLLGPLILILFFTGVGLYDKAYDRDEEKSETGDSRE